MTGLQKSSTISVRPTPSPLKAELQNLDITVGAAAIYAGRSYPYVLNMLNGVSPMQPNVESKIRELIAKVKSGKC
jgi:hypothetical protein